MLGRTQRNAYVSKAIRWCGLSVGCPRSPGSARSSPGSGQERSRSSRSVLTPSPTAAHRRCSSGDSTVSALASMTSFVSSGEPQGVRRDADPDRALRRERDRRAHRPFRARPLPGRPRAHRRFRPGTARPPPPGVAPARRSAPEHRTARRRHPEPCRCGSSRRHTRQPRARHGARLVVVRRRRRVRHSRLPTRRRLEDEPLRGPPTRRNRSRNRPNPRTPRSSTPPPAARLDRHASLAIHRQRSVALDGLARTPSNDTIEP